MDKSTLYLVPTPIGNLKDITLRAIDILEKVDLILCEDTRHTKKLLTHYGINKPLVSCERFSEVRKIAYIIDQLDGGKNIALVSDAGTPTVSDPGSRIVAQIRAKGGRVEALPGPCACITALSASGFQAPFRFIGFFPRQKDQREKELLRMKASTDVTICYESPRRLLSMIILIKGFMPDRTLCVARELTKIHEEYIIGTADELISQLEAHEIKGEVTVIVSGASDSDILDHESIKDRAMFLLESGHSRKDVLYVLFQETGMGRNELYKMLIHLKKD
jgi:16S rRNA (cytidine1402-2'-O)-methyltransferase